MKLVVYRRSLTNWTLGIWWIPLGQAPNRRVLVLGLDLGPFEWSWERP